ncbi:MAG: hypothetical protein RB191_12535, partial [Terriglobia bacterium]|nr:hypothetical protein [Terriglobia bacterium]
QPMVLSASMSAMDAFVTQHTYERESIRVNDEKFYFLRPRDLPPEKAVALLFAGFDTDTANRSLRG